MSLHKHIIQGDTPSAQFELPVYEFGKQGGRKIYLQAGMHADEHPGMSQAEPCCGAAGNRLDLCIDAKLTSLRVCPEAAACWRKCPDSS